jgi:ATP-binding cassette subfamily A (ABC1) protein 3
VESLDRCEARSYYRIHNTCELGSPALGSSLSSVQFLDEADLLGDRVAVLAAPGKLLAEGPPVSLKSSLGEGYRIVVQSGQDLQPDAEQSVTTATHEDLLSIIQQHAPKTLITSLSISSITFALKTKDPNIVKEILVGLENEQKNGRIGGYEVNSTSLEDIFLDLMGKDRELHESSDEDGPSDEKLDDNNSLTPVPSGGPANPHLTPLDLAPARPTSLLYQSMTIFYKRLLILRRSWLAPLLAIAIACCGACIPLFFLNDRVVTCAVTFRPTRTSSLWLPLSRVGIDARNASLVGSLLTDEGDQPLPIDVYPRIAPPDVLNTLGRSVARIPTVKLADKSSFIQDIQQNARNLTAGGIWVDTSSRQALLAYEATGNLNGPTMLNLVSNVLFSAVGGGDGKTIVANYMAFPVKSARGILALKWVSLVYDYIAVIFNGAPLARVLWSCYGSRPFHGNLQILNLVQAVFPAFFTLYVSKERRSSVQAMQLSNGISNPAGMWFGHLLFDGIPGIIIATITAVVFATTQSDQFKFIPLLVCFFFSLTQLST